jgi:hypothetical protein
MEEEMAQGLDSTKTPARPSHEALEESTGDATDVAKSEEHKMDHMAMESAKRSQNRIHSDEEKIPGSTIFSK